MASNPYSGSPAEIRRIPAITTRFAANRPCGYSSFWMRVMIWASRRCN